VQLEGLGKKRKEIEERNKERKRIQCFLKIAGFFFLGRPL
jgi:hypothetical protein